MVNFQSICCEEEASDLKALMEQWSISEAASFSRKQTQCQWNSGSWKEQASDADGFDEISKIQKQSNMDAAPGVDQVTSKMRVQAMHLARRLCKHHCAVEELAAAITLFDAVCEKMRSLAFIDNVVLLNDLSGQQFAASQGKLLEKNVRSLPQGDADTLLGSFADLDEELQPAHETLAAQASKQEGAETVCDLAVSASDEEHLECVGHGWFHEDSASDLAASFSNISDYYLCRNLGNPVEGVRFYKFHRSWNTAKNEVVESIVHASTGITLPREALLPQCVTGKEDDLAVYYHYTHEVAYYSIMRSQELWATLLESNPNKKDTCFGDGLYLTQRSPQEFQTKTAVLINNFSNSADPEKQMQHIAKFSRNADYCIPIIAPRAMVIDVMTKTTPEMQFGPGRTRLGVTIQPNRDIHVLALRHSESGKVHHVKQSVEVLLRRIGDRDDPWTRRDAIRSLVSSATIEDEGIVEEMFLRLVSISQMEGNVEVRKAAEEGASILLARQTLGHATRAAFEAHCAPPASAFDFEEAERRKLKQVRQELGSLENPNTFADIVAAIVRLTLKSGTVACHQEKLGPCIDTMTEVRVIELLDGRIRLPSIFDWSKGITSRLYFLSAPDEDLCQVVQQAAPIIYSWAIFLMEKLAASSEIPPKVLALNACSLGLVNAGAMAVEEVVPVHSPLESLEDVKKIMAAREARFSKLAPSAMTIYPTGHVQVTLDALAKAACYDVEEVRLLVSQVAGQAQLLI